MIIPRYTRSLLLSLVRRAPSRQQQQQQFITFKNKSVYRVNFARVMSTAPHPVSSTAEPPKAAEGLEPVTAGASSTPAAAAAAAPAKQAQPKEAKEGKPKKDKSGGGSSGPLELTPPPGYFEERIKIFDEYKAKYDAEVAGESLRRITAQGRFMIQY